MTNTTTNGTPVLISEIKSRNYKSENEEHHNATDIEWGEQEFKLNLIKLYVRNFKKKKDMRNTREYLYQTLI